MTEPSLPGRRDAAEVTGIVNGREQLGAEAVEGAGVRNQVLAALLASEQGPDHQLCPKSASALGCEPVISLRDQGLEPVLPRRLQQFGDLAPIE